MAYELLRPSVEATSPRGHRPTAPRLPRETSLLRSRLRLLGDVKPRSVLPIRPKASDIGITVIPPRTSGFFQGFETFSLLAASSAAEVAASLAVEEEQESSWRALRGGITRRVAPPHVSSLSPSSARSPLNKTELFRAPTPLGRSRAAFAASATSASTSEAALLSHLPIHHPARQPFRHKAPPPRMIETSPLCLARDLEHKRQIEEAHPECRAKEQPRGAGGAVDDDDPVERAVLMTIKTWIRDQTTVQSWMGDKAIADWKRVRTTRNGRHVTGISLVSCGLEVDLSDLGPELLKLPRLRSLLIHGNPNTTGDLTHLAALIDISELRLSGDRLEGNLLALAGLFQMKKLRIYNRTKAITGLASDLEVQLPDCDVQLPALVSTTAP